MVPDLPLKDMVLEAGQVPSQEPSNKKIKTQNCQPMCLCDFFPDVDFFFSLMNGTINF